MFDIPDDPPPWPLASASPLTPAQVNNLGRALAHIKLPDDFDYGRLASLARETAMDIKELETILRQFGLSSDQYAVIQQMPLYQQILQAEQQQWQSTKNTPDRIKLEAAALFEEAMPKLYARIINPMENLNHAIEGAKLIAKVAGVGESQGPATAGEKFSITINLGDKPVTYERQLNPVIEGEACSGASPLPADPEGQGNSPALQLLRQGD